MGDRMRVDETSPLPRRGAFVNLWERIPPDDNERIPGGCDFCPAYLTFQSDSDRLAITTWHAASCPMLG